MKPIPLHPHPMKLNAIDELLADLRAGRMVVLMDDEDRENEGDLIMAAGLVQQIVGLHRSQLPSSEDHPADPKVLRTYGIGAQILSDLGARRLRVMSAPKAMRGIAGFGLEVVEYVDRT